MTKNKPVEQKPEEVETPEETTPVEQKPEVKSVSKTQVKVETEMVERESGLIVPETKIKVKQPFYAKKYDSESWAVYSEAGELKKIYSQRDGCTPEECERGSKNLAKKLSNQFIEKSI